MANSMLVNPSLNSILKDVFLRRHIFLHGPGGVGKSWLLGHIAHKLTELGMKVFVTATTGVAAVGLSNHELKVCATTLHRFAGVGTATLGIQALIGKVRTNFQSRQRWEKCQVLIIDEISMLGAELFQKLHAVACAIRRNDKPMGGIQLIVSGDLLQLPPVKDDWIFKTSEWQDLNIRPFILEKPYRYDDDDFFQLLIRIRMGDLSEDDFRTLRRRVRANQKMHDILDGLVDADPAEIIRPTMFFSRRLDVDAFNDRELDKLKGKLVEFVARDSFVALKGNPTLDDYSKLLDDDMPRSVSFKVGAQVMLRVNLDTAEGLVNGSRGVVTEIIPGEAMIVKFLSGTKLRVDVHTRELEDKYAIATRTQIPFILAYAMTIHKCVSGDTLIFTDRGFRYMKDVVVEEGWCKKDIKLHTLDGKERTSMTFKGEVESSIRLTTRMGYTIEGSVRHPVLVRTDRGDHIWKKLPDISAGDHLVIRKEYVFPTDHVKTDYFQDPPIPEITEDIGFMLGLLVGDGSYRDKRDGTVDLTNNDRDVLKRFKNIAEVNLGVRVCTYRNRVYFCRKKVRNFLFSSGLGYTKGPEKSIPWIILQSPVSVVSAFLRGLFDADGGVNKTTDISEGNIGPDTDGVRIVHFTSSSSRLTTEVHNVLLAMGIISRRVQMPNDHSGAWRVELTGHDARLYREMIGFTIRAKTEKLATQFMSACTIPKANIGFLPDSKHLANELQRTYNLSGGCSRLVSECKSGRSRIHIRHIPYIMGQMQNLDAHKIGRDLVEFHDKGLFTDPVVEINVGNCVMYDVEVPGSHSFIGNGIVNHNSQGSTLDYAVVNLGPSIFAEGQAYVALSRCVNIRGLFISELVPSSIMANKAAVGYSKELVRKAAEEDSY